MSRYIDAEEFYVSQVARCWGEPIIGTCTSDNALLYDELQKHPTADVAEVKHGKWMLEREPNGKPYCYHCSVCDNDYHFIGIKTQYHYCPNCGARMEDCK